eukprot:7384837-Prymnesium_polylepis.2
MACRIAARTVRSAGVDHAGLEVAVVVELGRPAPTLVHVLEDRVNRVDGAAAHPQDNDVARRPLEQRQAHIDDPGAQHAVQDLVVRVEPRRVEHRMEACGARARVGAGVGGRGRGCAGVVGRGRAWVRAQ